MISVDSIAVSLFVDILVEFDKSVRDSETDPNNQISCDRF